MLIEMHLTCKIKTDVLYNSVLIKSTLIISGYLLYPYPFFLLISKYYLITIQLESPHPPPFISLLSKANVKPHTLIPDMNMNFHITTIVNPLNGQIDLFIDNRNVHCYKGIIKHLRCFNKFNPCVFFRGKIIH